MDDRPGVPLLADLLGLLRRAPHVPRLPGTFLALEGGEGAGKSTQLGAARRLAARRRPRGRRHARARRHAAGRAAAGAAARGRATSARGPRRCSTPPTARTTSTRSCGPRSSAAPSCSPTASSTPRWPTRAPVATSTADEVARLRRWATGGLRPDLVLLLDVDPAVGLARAAQPGAPDRLEAESLAFHQRVRAGLPGPRRRRPPSATSSSPPTSRRRRAGGAARAGVRLLPPVPAAVRA